MTRASIGPLILLLAVVLAAVATVLVFLCRRDGVDLTAPGSSTFDFLRNPEKYVRQPYAKIARVLGVAALVLAVLFIFVAILMHVLHEAS